MQPNFFYGSLLAVFGIEIVADWLGRSWAKVSRAEYTLLWVTFLAICQGADTATHPPCNHLRITAIAIETMLQVAYSQMVHGLSNACKDHGRVDMLSCIIHVAQTRVPLTWWLTVSLRCGDRCAVGLELGIAIGVALATMWFAFSYAQVHITSFAVVPSRSGAVRSAAQVRSLQSRT